METVLAAFIIILLLLTAAFTFADATLTSFEMMMEEWQALDARMTDQHGAQIMFVEGRTFDDGQRLEVLLRNSGSRSFSAFERWDVIVRYSDVMGSAHVGWLPYSAQPLAPDQWTVSGLLLGEGQPEVYQSGQFDPGELLRLSIRLSTSLQHGVPAQVVVATGEGTMTSGVLERNALPTMTHLEPLRIASGGAGMVSADRLWAEDADNAADALIYTIITPPTQGTLTLSSPFTQADIDAGLLAYTHTGSGDDSFGFTVTDGQDTIGPLTFSIALDAAPTLTANIAASGPALTPITITGALLAADDADDPAVMLRYSVIIPPSQGVLNLGSSFTQDDLNAGRLTYTGSASDQFLFSISDGKSTIGPFPYTITVTP